MDEDTYLVGFCFALSLKNGDVDAAFQEISGISKEWVYEDVGCGGENNFKYRLPKVTKFPNLVLKRGITQKDSPLTKWCMETLDGELADPIKPKDLTVSVLNADGIACLSWNFTRAYPIKWSVSPLKSQENAMLIESIELAYQYFKTK